MKKFGWAVLAALLLPCWVMAQFKLSGTVQSQQNAALSGVSVKLLNKGYVVLTDNKGGFEFLNLSAGQYRLVVSHVGFEQKTFEVELESNKQVKIQLAERVFVADEVVVSATRAEKNAAFAFKNLDKKAIENVNQGQDLPYLFNNTPSAVVTSDAGAGIGYSGIRIRGSDASRINVTLNGIPFNDPESHATYFVNLPDFASSVDNIQVQRGVGTSTNGAGAFGASINIQTLTKRDSAYAEINSTVGSYNTWKNTLSLGSGLINGRFSIDGRLSRIKSDGYIDRAFADLKSYFVSGAYYGKKDILRVNIFSGLEKTYQAWNGVEERILSTNRRHNDYTYDNQTDNYQQDHYQLFYTRNLSTKLLANIAFHYTYGRGYYEEYKTNRKLVDYNITPPVIGGVQIDRSDLVRRRWLDNGFYGTTYSLNYKPSNAAELIFGGAYNAYNGNHFGEVVWAQYANYDASNSLRNRYEDNDAFKSDFNVFAKANYRVSKLLFFADLQYRNVYYSYFGLNQQAQLAQQNARLEFFNPKFGLSYQINPASDVYASVAIGNKEPNRRDFTDSSISSRPKSEHLTDFELGYRRQGKNYNVSLNGFAMLYRDQLINTGQLNDVGGFTRQNVPDSYRLGVELDASLQLTKKLTWAATAALSRNKIKDFTEYIYDNVNGNLLTFNYKDVDIAYSPNFVASSDFTYRLSKLNVSLLSKYVSRQYFDNSQTRSRSLSDYFINDIRLRYQLSILGLKNVDLNLMVNNVFDVKYSANGSTYPDLNGGVLDRYNYFFPQATRNYLFSLGIRL